MNGVFVWTATETPHNRMPEQRLNTPYLKFPQLPRPFTAFFVVDAIYHRAHDGFFRVRIWINLKQKEINRPLSRGSARRLELVARELIWYTAQFRNKASSNVPPSPVLVSSSRQSSTSTLHHIYNKNWLIYSITNALGHSGHPV
jgi:hypothetical protein